MNAMLQPAPLKGDGEASPPFLADVAHIHPDLRHLARPLASIRLDPANARTHDRRNIEAIKASLREFGQRIPLVVRAVSGTLEAGEGRVLAAQELGWRWIAAIACDDDALAAARFSIADNRSHDLSAFDEERLAALIVALDEEGAAQGLGFLDQEIGRLRQLAEREQALQDEDVPAPPATPWSRPGDLVVLGPHRVLCGDSTDRAVVSRLMEGELADLVFTDPPYGVRYVGKASALAEERRTLAGDDLGLEGTRDLIERAASAWPLKVGGVWYVCSASGDMETMFRVGLLDAGERVRQQIVWRKNALVLSHFDYQHQHETILYGWHDGAAHYWCGSRTETSVWDVDKPTRAAEHPTMKPVELPARALANSSRAGEIVFDGFGGSGSTLAAAQQLGRRARLVELNPAFVDVIVQRAVRLGLPAQVVRGGQTLAWGGP